jgi:hypothetical protein
MSADPIMGDPSNPQTWNRYAYALNSPAEIVDPMGLRGNGENPNDILLPAGPGNCVLYPGACVAKALQEQWYSPAGEFGTLDQQIDELEQCVVWGMGCPGASNPQDGMGSNGVVYQTIRVGCGGTYSGEEITSLECDAPPQAVDDSGPFLITPGLQALFHGPDARKIWRNAPGFVAVVAGASILAGTGGYAVYDIAQIEEGALFGTRLGGNTPLLNSNNFLRVGWSYIRSTGEYTFRIGGDLLNGGHINLWPPSWWF